MKPGMKRFLRIVTPIIIATLMIFTALKLGAFDKAIGAGDVALGWISGYFMAALSAAVIIRLPKKVWMADRNPFLLVSLGGLVFSITAALLRAGMTDLISTTVGTLFACVAFASLGLCAGIVIGSILWGIAVFMQIICEPNEPPAQNQPKE